VIGSGGDAATCAGVLLALSQATPLGSSGGGTGLGCYADGAGGAGHVIVPATTQAAKAGSARRVCACMQ